MRNLCLQKEIPVVWVVLKVLSSLNPWYLSFPWKQTDDAIKAFGFGKIGKIGKSRN